MNHRAREVVSRKLPHFTSLEKTMNHRVKEVVSRKPIKRGIRTVRKKLIELKRREPKSLSESEAIFRQLLQLELCEIIINDMHMI
jgi:hypothetical protein